jgi:hypothetical protein
MVVGGAHHDHALWVCHNHLWGVLTAHNGLTQLENEFDRGDDFDGHCL